MILLVVRTGLMCTISSRSCCSLLDGFQPQILDQGIFEDSVSVLFEETNDGMDLWFPNILRCSGSESRLADCPVELFTEEGATPEQALLNACSALGVGVRCPTEGEL